MERISHSRCFNGWQSQYQHESSSLNCNMQFSIYMPPQASDNHPVPILYWLSGLTATHENFMQKAGAQRIAAELGIALVASDTSPRGDHVADDEAYDLGQGAGFYVNATQAPWDMHYHMDDYIVTELPTLISKNFAVNDQCSISGHSMGGHGALVLALRNPHNYQSVSAFAPICHPTQAPWGQKAFHHYLGDDQSTWEAYDTCCLLQQTTVDLPIRIDQGEADEWLGSQLYLDQLAQTAAQTKHSIDIYRHAGYDHNYYFVATFIEQQLRFHAQYLCK